MGERNRGTGSCFALQLYSGWRRVHASTVCLPLWRSSALVSCIEEHLSQKTCNAVSFPPWTVAILNKYAGERFLRGRLFSHCSRHVSTSQRDPPSALINHPVIQDFHIRKAHH
jgi:hypothetical protein